MNSLSAHYLYPPLLLLSKPKRFFYSGRQLALQNIVRFVWWQIKTVETVYYVSMPLSHRGSGQLTKYATSVVH